MPIHIAPSRRSAPKPVARSLAGVAPGRAANDDLREGGESPDAQQAILVAALRHFALHGLAAAAVAEMEAERARLAGSQEECERWISICRALDRRKAENAVSRWRLPCG